MNSLVACILLPLLGLLTGNAWSFVLEGSSTSYAQFHKWNAALNGSLEFEFKTEQGNGLLVYTDDGGTYDFFEVKLVESALRLRYNLGGGAQIVTVGHDLGDGHWHKVQIARNNENTTLTVDGVSATSTSRGKEYEFGRYTGNSDVYVGGMPSWYNSKLTLLALPSVIFEPRFNGLIRNLVYADGENLVPKRQEMKSRDAKCGGFPCVEAVGQRKTPRSLRNMIAANTTDACETRDPCQHGGICISTDSGPICECRTGDYEGIYCEKEAWSTVLPTAGAGDYWAWDYNKAPSEASFKGTEYLRVELSKGEPVQSIQESVSLQFKTRQHNGLLFYSGEGGDYLTISLKDGGAAVGMTLANGRLDLHIKPARVRFDDNQWHKIIVHRRVQEISAITSFCKIVKIALDYYKIRRFHTRGRRSVNGTENLVKESQPIFHVKHSKRNANHEEKLYYPSLLVVMESPSKWPSNKQVEAKLIFQKILYALTYWNEVDNQLKRIQNPGVRIRIAGIVIECDRAVTRSLEYYSLWGYSLYRTLRPTLRYWQQARKDIRFFREGTFNVVASMTLTSPGPLKSYGASARFTGCGSYYSDETGNLTNMTGLLVYDDGRFSNIKQAVAEISHIMGRSATGVGASVDASSFTDSDLVDIKSKLRYASCWAKPLEIFPPGKPVERLFIGDVYGL